MGKGNISSNWQEEVISLSSFPGFLQLCAIRFEMADIRRLHKTYEVRCAECGSVVPHDSLEELLKYFFSYEKSGEVRSLENFRTGLEFGQVSCISCGHQFVRIHFDPYIADRHAYDLPAFGNLMKSLEER